MKKRNRIPGTVGQSKGPDYYRRIAQRRELRELRRRMSESGIEPAPRVGDRIPTYQPGDLVRLFQRRRTP